MVRGGPLAGGTLSVINVLGKEVLRTALGHGQPTMPLDLSALAPGTYTVVVQNTHGTSANRVVVER